MAENKKVSKKQQACVNRYIKANYDRINVTLPKGQKAVLQAAAASQNLSVNAFIVNAANYAIDNNIVLTDSGTNHE